MIVLRPPTAPSASILQQDTIVQQRARNAISLSLLVIILAFTLWIVLLQDKDLVQAQALMLNPLLAGFTLVVSIINGLMNVRTMRDMEQRQEDAQLTLLALSESEERYRLIADNASDLIALLDVDGYVLYASPSFERMLGYPLVQLIGMDMGNLFHPDDQAIARSNLLQTRIHGSAQGSYRAAHADGTWRWLERRLTLAMQDEQSYLVMVARDTTNQRALEAEFRHAQKMEAMGRLAGSVAHDFNNLLVAIGGYAEMVATSLPDDHEVQPDIVEICQATRRAADLTRQLLAFARRQPITPQVILLDQLIENMMRLLQRMLGNQIECITQIEPDLFAIRADPSQIEQVLMNMAVNARDAMPNGGIFKISAANICRFPFNRTTDLLLSSEYIIIEISDTGVGMTEEVMRHLFEPFFTTKGPDQGTGLGLATCYGIITQSGGLIQVRSRLGLGTTFTILLPRAHNDYDSNESGNEPPPEMAYRAILPSDTVYG